MSRLTHDDSNPHKIIPISFNMYTALYETYYSIETQDRYLVQTWSQTNIDWNNITRSKWSKENAGNECITRKLKPQIQREQVDKIRPRLGQGRAGIRCKKPQPVADITVSASKSHKIPTVQNVTKDSTAFPVPEQLITNDTEANTRREIQGQK